MNDNLDISGLSEDELRELDISDEELEFLLEQMKKAEAERAERLDALGVAIATLRSEAIEGRAQSGIEDEWQEDEEFYAGIDERNLGDNHAWKHKPPGRAEASDNASGSTIFLNITGQYVDSASASLGDMLLPTNENTFAIEPTPVPEFIPISEGNIPKEISGQILEQVGGNQKLAQDTENKMVEQTKDTIEAAKKKAESAQTRIEDWLVECQYTAEVRKVVEDAARIGSGVLKGPVPVKSRNVAYIEGELVVDDKKIKPASFAVSPWNLYPDPGCGDSVHNGAYVFEKDYITGKKLKQLKGVPGYLDGQIDAVIEEGPSEATKVAPNHPEIDGADRDKSNLYEIWYFYGEIKKDDLEAADCPCEEDLSDAHMVLVNNRVIKADQNVLDGGEFPYDVMVWKRRLESPWGTGIARLIRTPQRIINGAARNLMDNAGLAGGPMWAYKPGLISPIEGVPELRPRKGWMASEDADMEDISKAFTFFKMDMMTQELQSIIMLGMKFAEDVTGLPMLIQGQMGQSQPDTLGQTQILNNNATTVRRRIARLYDDLVTEPHIRRYYKYLLQHGENDDEKGEFVISAKGSSNLVERAMEKQELMELGKLAQNPIYNLDPKKWAAEYLRSKKYHPDQFAYDDEEWKQMVQKMLQPPKDPRTQVAQINAQGRQQIVGMELQQDSAEKEKDRQFKLAIEQMEQEFEAEMAHMERQGVSKDILDQSRVRLNETVMKLRTQKELSGITQVTTPPTEPIGLAQDGRAYSQ